MEQKRLPFLAISVLILILGLVGLYLFKPQIELPKLLTSLPIFKQPTGNIVINGKTELKPTLVRFTSEADFKDYLQKGQQMGLGGNVGTFSSMKSLTSQGNITLQAPGMGPGLVTDSTLERSSQTNVQIKGIDEPDIVKTDGQNIYYSGEPILYRPLGMGISNGAIAVKGIVQQPKYPTTKTKIISALPVSSLAVKASIEQTGELLLNEGILVVLANNQLIGYDIKNPTEPSKSWQIVLDDNERLVSSRLYQRKLYLISQHNINFSRPCPITPLTASSRKITIACTNIYHPSFETNINTTYTISLIDPRTGQVEKTTAVTGSLGSSVVYISNNALYLTYSFNTDQSLYLYNFYNERAKDLLPAQLLSKLAKLQEYDLSNQTKLTEVQVLLSRHEASLGEDTRLKFNNEIANRMTDYSYAHLRDYQKTGIAKVKLADLTVAENGQIPGTVLNQFSLDEYQDNLRIATTVQAYMGQGISANDVYILDNNLKQLGQVLDLGQGEKIYSARFIEDRGYLVTFKQTDPFYILDLKSPSSPKISGQLKIPGYSSYLDPIADNRILGVGKEDNKVKLSLFDVSLPDNPREIDKYTLDEYWSDILNTHHGFLLDSKHQVFFIPGTKGGYIFSYSGDKLNLKKAVEEVQAKRAVYINDYLYILGQDKLVVLDEKTWEVVNKLSF